MAAAGGDGEAIVCLLMPERRKAAVLAAAGTSPLLSTAAAAEPLPAGTTGATAATVGAALLPPAAVDSQSSAAKFLLIEVCSLQLGHRERNRARPGMQEGGEEESSATGHGGGMAECGDAVQPIVAFGWAVCEGETLPLAGGFIGAVDGACDPYCPAEGRLGGGGACRYSPPNMERESSAMQ